MHGSGEGVRRVGGGRGVRKKSVRISFHPLAIHSISLQSVLLRSVIRLDGRLKEWYDDTGLPLVLAVHYVHSPLLLWIRSFMSVHCHRSCHLCSDQNKAPKVWQMLSLAAHYSDADNDILLAADFITLSTVVSSMRSSLRILTDHVPLM